MARNRKRKIFKGYTVTTKGYKLILLPDHPNAGRYGYVMEHRVVMESAIGRFLTKDEVVHHKNGVKDDNRLENLELMTKKQHDSLPKPRRPIICPNCNHHIARSGYSWDADPI